MNKTQNLISNKEIIIATYLKGETIKTLAVKYDVSAAWMRKFLIDNEIKIVHNTKQRKFNESFFLTPSVELAYFMGFCLADGSISAKENHRSTLEISVHTQDKCILEKFCKWTNYNSKFIAKRNNKELFRLCFNSKIFKQDFSAWGLVSNKTYEPVMPTIDKEYIIPFILGYIDGDGSIKFSSKGNQFNIVGNRELINWFCQIIKDLGFKQKFKFEDIDGKVWKRARLYKKKISYLCFNV